MVRVMVGMRPMVTGTRGMVLSWRFQFSRGNGGIFASATRGREVWVGLFGWGVGVFGWGVGVLGRGVLRGRTRMFGG